MRKKLPKKKPKKKAARSSSRGIKWTRITIHHSASPDVSAGQIRRWHLARGWDDIGYHLVIRSNGSVEFGRALTIMGAHVLHENQGNIGICLTGNFNVRPPTLQQILVAEGLVMALRHAYQIPREQVFFHRDMAKTDCPGKHFPFLFNFDYHD